MGHNKKTAVPALILSLLSIVAVVGTFLALTPSGPLENTEQIVLVIADNPDSSRASLLLFDKSGSGWTERLSCPAVIGKNGTGWGIGLHGRGDAAPGDAVKQEGDGKSPEGVFPLLEAFGYPPPEDVDTGMTYIQSGRCWICCDDSASKHYNRVFDYSDKRLDENALPSHEDMKRDDDLYKYTILVGHNYWKPVEGAGSCIFIHLWGGPDSHTAGCTAIPEESMVPLLHSLDAAKNPVMVLLTDDNYGRLKKRWGLPAL